MRTYIQIRTKRRLCQIFYSTGGDKVHRPTGLDSLVNIDGEYCNELFDTMSAECFYQKKLFNFIGKRVKIEQPCAQNDSITLEEYLKAIADYQQLHGQISEQIRGSLHVNSYDEKRKSGGYDAVITLSAPPRK